MFYGIARIMRRSRTGTIISIFICLIIGFGIMAGLAIVFIADQKFNAQSIETEGTVIGIYKTQRTSYSRRGRRQRKYDVFVATVKYYDSDGSKYTCTSKGDDDPLSNYIGEKVKVKYNKINPADGRLLQDEKKKDVAFGIGAAFGLFFIILAITAWVKRRPFNKAEWERRRLLTVTDT